MRTIVHISADYPDPSVPGKTHAIKNLISASHGYRHVVYSLNRSSRVSGISTIRFGEDATSLLYGAPPKGLFLKYSMEQVARWICRDLRDRNIAPDLFHAHKLTIEGIAAQKLASEFAVPFAVSIQGDTDLKVSKFKPGLRRRFSQIWLEAEYVFPFSKWADEHFSKLFGQRDKPTKLLPCITPQDRLLTSEPTDRKRIVSIFHLDSWKRKNAQRLIEAVKKVSANEPDLVLDIYGSGSVASRRGLSNCIKRNRADGVVTLKGAVAHDRVQETINGYSAFALPSLRESFGMAAAEALMSGVPVLISRDWGIDGIFPENEIGGVCDPCSVDHMAQKLRAILSDEAQLKAQISKSQRIGNLDILRTGSIVETYLTALADIEKCRAFRPVLVASSPAALQT